jgi:hypothetical protein
MLRLLVIPVPVLLIIMAPLAAVPIIQDLQNAMDLVLAIRMLAIITQQVLQRVSPSVRLLLHKFLAAQQHQRSALPQLLQILAIFRMITGQMPMNVLMPNAMQNVMALDCATQLQLLTMPQQQRLVFQRAIIL